MLKTIGDKTTRDIYDGLNSRNARRIPTELHAKARRLLDQINAATAIDVLRIPPSNRLEKLRGNLGMYWSVRVNDQWRVIFQWHDGDAYDVKIIDYH